MYRDQPRLRGGGDDAEDDEMDCASSPIRHQQGKRFRTPSPRRNNNNMDTAMTDGEQQWPVQPPGAPRWHRDENDFRNRPTRTLAAGVAGPTNPHVEVNHGSGSGTPDTGLGQTYCLFHSNYSASARSQCRLVPNSSLEEMYNCGSQVQEPAPPTRVDATADTMSMHSQTGRDERDVQMWDDDWSQPTMLSPLTSPGVQVGKRKASPEAELPEKKRSKDEGPKGGPEGGQGYL